MNKNIKHFLLMILPVVSLTTSCKYVDILNPFRVNTYDHAYDDLEISTLESRYTDYSYKDIQTYSAYDGVGYCPSVGEAKFLVVPIWFTNSNTYIFNRNTVKQDIEKAYFGNEDSTGWESVSTYYKKDSFNRLTITGTVLDWYECGDSSSTYYYNTSKTVSLVRKAAEYASNYVDLDDYDADKDGYIDGLILIYAAPDYTHLNGYEENMWAYTYWRFVNPVEGATIANQFFWASYDFMYSQGSDALIRTGKSNFGSGDTSHCNIDAHTFIHETGHLFGLEDYYDYSGKASPALAFSMQDHNVGGHDPYSRLALNWAKAYIPSETVKVKLRPIEESGEVIILKNSRYTSSFNEYLVLEYYSPIGLNKFDVDYTYGGYDKGPNQEGIRLWHVDSRLVTYGTTFKSITSKPTDGEVMAATNNSSYQSGPKNRAVNYAGSYEYNMNEVIRNNYDMIDEQGLPIENDDRDKNSLSNNDLFLEGDYFTTHNYREQFVNYELLNSKRLLKWSFYIDRIDNGEATITLIKW